MHVLFVHRSGSGQFAHLIARLVAEGAEVTLVTEHAAPERPGVRQLTYALGQPTTTHATLAATDYHMRTGEAVAATSGARCGDTPRKRASVTSSASPSAIACPARREVRSVTP